MMSNNFTTNIIDLYGPLGQQWLNKLPEITNQIAVTWGLSGLQPVKNLSYNYVLSGFRSQQPVVLKTSLDVEALKQEASALHAFNGYGAARVLEEMTGALLLERAIPGISLKSYFPHQDTEATYIACKVIQKLHQAPAPQSKFSHIRDWLQILDQDWNIPSNYLKKARYLRDQLLNASTQSILLHGDLHHDNILQQGEDWIVIDPKGVIGDPIYDKIGCLIREPLSEFLKQPQPLDILRSRLKIIANYSDLDPMKIWEWSFIQSVLACCWSLEDHQQPIELLHFIELLMNNTLND